MTNGTLGKILVLDDDSDVLLAAQMYLKQHARQVRTERDPGLLPALIREGEYDIVLLDMNFTRDVSSGQEGFYWLEQTENSLRIAPLVLFRPLDSFRTLIKAS